MTDALKAMVEAMAAEIEAQTNRQLTLDDDGRTMEPGIYAAEQFDLEKVARAGLAAVRDPGAEVDAGVKAADNACHPFLGTEDEGVPADPADARHAWTYCIDAILKP